MPLHPTPSPAVSSNGPSKWTGAATGTPSSRCSSQQADMENEAIVLCDEGILEPGLFDT